MVTKLPKKIFVQCTKTLKKSSYGGKNLCLVQKETVPRGLIKRRRFGSELGETHKGIDGVGRLIYKGDQRNQVSQRRKID